MQDGWLGVWSRFEGCSRVLKKIRQTSNIETGVDVGCIRYEYEDQPDNRTLPTFSLINAALTGLEAEREPAVRGVSIVSHTAFHSLCSDVT